MAIGCGRVHHRRLLHPFGRPCTQSRNRLHKDHPERKDHRDQARPGLAGARQAQVACLVARRSQLRRACSTQLGDREQDKQQYARLFFSLRSALNPHLTRTQISMLCRTRCVHRSHDCCLFVGKAVSHATGWLHSCATSAVLHSHTLASCRWSYSV